ncbi:MAG: phage tail protein [Lachnospiraceae bacterium]|nr:phage tail protein [Lachnospiraceae bacterium]
MVGSRMIKLQDSQITQILPEYLSERESVQALSFALHKAVERLIRHCGNISVFSAIDTASGNILDLLAEELDTQYYDDSLPIDAKRKLIQNTLSWYMGTGTPGAVEELVTAVYGHGEVEEWFEYGGEPHFFRISITNMEVKPGQNKEFRHILSKIKRLSAHLDAIRYVFHEEINQPIRYELAMTFAGDFWPRSNLPLHLLNGTTRLDGRYPLSGYLSGQSLDFYPAALRISCEAGECAETAAGGRTAFCCGAAETAESKAALHIRSEGKAGTETAGAMQVSADAGEAGRTAATGHLRVEKNWGTLDGSGRLDGSRTLDAEAYEVEV